MRPTHSQAIPYPAAQRLKFSTPDKSRGFNCSAEQGGSWWCKSCFGAKLIGIYLKQGHYSSAEGIRWYLWLGFEILLKLAEMKLKQRGKGRIHQIIFLLALIHAIFVRIHIISFVLQVLCIEYVLSVIAYFIFVAHLCSVQLVISFYIIVIILLFIL